jgi:hypothetical protein
MFPLFDPLFDRALELNYHTIDTGFKLNQRLNPNDRLRRGETAAIGFTALFYKNLP